MMATDAGFSDLMEWAVPHRSAVASHRGTLIISVMGRRRWLPAEIPFEDIMTRMRHDHLCRKATAAPLPRGYRLTARLFW